MQSTGQASTHAVSFTPMQGSAIVAFFARAQRVEEARLLAELNETARTSVLQPGCPDYTPGPGDVIYRRFFRAAILTMFTSDAFSAAST